MGRTKRELARELAQELNVSEAKALRLIQRLLRKLVEDLARSGRVELRGFGSFRTVRRPAQTLKSPKTGQPVEVPEYRSVEFRASQTLRKRLGPRPDGGAGGGGERPRRRPPAPPPDPGDRDPTPGG